VQPTKYFRELRTLAARGFLRAAVLLSIFTAFPACLVAGEDSLLWVVHLAVAKESDQEDLVIPKALEPARKSLEELAERSKFRTFRVVRMQMLELAQADVGEVTYSNRLSVGFDWEIDDKRQTYVRLTWLKCDPKKEQKEALGVKVRNRFRRSGTLAVVGPPTKDGAVMAVLRLATDEEKQRWVAGKRD